jgi:hypothetical protein
LDPIGDLGASALGRPYDTVAARLRVRGMIYEAFQKKG